MDFTKWYIIKFSLKEEKLKIDEIKTCDAESNEKTDYVPVGSSHRK